MKISVQREDFDLSLETKNLSRSEGVGAVASFVGIVRDVRMTLEHYPGMTEKELTRISDEALARWPLSGTVIVHRVGRLEPGARIVLCAAASAHRQAAFEACAFLIDFLKTQAPFWKREETASGERWVEARAGDDAAAARWKS